MTDGLNRRTLLGGIAGTAALAGLAACGADRDARPSSSRSVKPKRGGHLTAAFVGGSNESPSVLQAEMTGLTSVRARAIWDPIGELDQFRPRWRVAESVEHNADATQWTIRVRPGIEFSDGSPLTAHDVASSITGYIKGKAEQGSLLSAVNLKAMRARDKHTLVIPLTAPDGGFDQSLAQSVFVYPAHTTDPNKAIGSGPFISQSFRSGQGAKLRRNPNYWGEGGPYLDTLELADVSDSGARADGVKSGQYDYAGAISLTTARSERSNPDLQVLVPDKSLWSGVAMIGNAKVAPFTSVDVRRALHYTFDRQKLARTVTSGLGLPGNDLFSNGDPDYASDIPQFGYDPDRAKSILVKSGHQSLRLTLMTSDFAPGMVETSTAWIEQAAAAGVTVSLNKIAANDYYSNIPKMLKTAFTTQPASAFPLAQDYLNYYSSEGAYPFSGLTKQADPLVTALRRAVGESARHKAAHTLQEWVMHNAAQYIPVRLPSVSLASNRVHGVDPAGFAEYPVFRDAFLA